jgi:hypothetical protein
MSWFRRALLVSFMLLAAACSYGPERTFLDLHTFVAKPHSHQFAASIEYARIKDPTGAVNTFPNGGLEKVISREARIYLGDLDRGTIDLVVAIPDFAGIPQPKSVRVEGWKADVLYFSLFGYGGNAWDGDDLSDERRIFYRATADGRVHEVDGLPPRLERERNSGPVTSPPFLRWSQGHLDVEIAIDARVSEAVELARLTFDPETGEPRLSLP